ncbi:hypothetical protein PIB30_041984 [Stylosanthes scabra]|uniref:C2H2-type domain-containing protein n=1 Tax=Stylosanthes scabra TaxID=79078 RepID=A0ABU6ZDV9_9FABA|nr:hypothetical protein [Stylosanthes scabra]
MEKKNPSSSSSSPPSTPTTEPPVPPPQATTEILKSVEEVLAELTAYEASGGSPPPPPPPPFAGAMAVGVGGEGVVMGEVGLGGSGAVGGGRKRKASEVKDPPTGTPTCPVCNKTFQSWKGAFGHMRKHPERQYRGFFKPPTFSPGSGPATGGTTTHGSREGGSSGATAGGQVGEGGSSSVRGQFDLNQPMERGAGDDEQGNAAEEGKDLGFDLNKPADEEDSA